MTIKPAWMCPRCGKANIGAYHKCVVCKRPQNAPKGWTVRPHDEAGSQPWAYSE